VKDATGNVTEAAKGVRDSLVGRPEDEPPPAA
jgi:hypothetical protein